MKTLNKKNIKSIIGKTNRDGYYIKKIGTRIYHIITYDLGVFQAISDYIRLSPYNWKVKHIYRTSPDFQASNVIQVTE